MNRNLSKAIVATVAALAGAQAAHAQYDPNCWPTGNNPHGPSTVYNFYELTDLLFQIGMGVTGTDGYTAPNNMTGDPNCGTETMTIQGRFGFAIGSTGSVQSSIDDNLSLTWGMPVSVGNSCGFAMVCTGTANAPTETLFGGGGITTAYYGASNRYFVMEAVVSGVDTHVRVDLVADAARFDWTLTNTTTAVLNAGLMVGSWVQPASLRPFDHDLTYVYTPGYKPFLTEQWFQRGTVGQQYPDTMTYAISQADCYGLQIINSPLTSPNIYGINAPDQTPTDEFVIGQGWDVLNHDATELASTTPAPPYPPIINTDVPFIEYPNGLTGGRGSVYLDDAAFLQYWRPIPLNSQTGSREIVAYYRSTWGVSDYQAPFGVVVDTPKTITTVPTNPSQFANGTFDFRVYLDNVGGYANVGKTVDLSNVRVSVSLPQGMVDATNPTGPNAQNLVGYITSIPYGTMSYVDFSVQTNTSIAPGPQSYQVVVAANTGASKTLYGTINVASTPTLDIRQNANLVGVPWIFSTSDWATILGLTPNQDFQAFTWSPTLNEYILQPNAQRGQGVFIVSATDHGQISLGGSPQQSSTTTPSNIIDQTSPVSLELDPGWNLIANPFNYAISLGQLLGIDQTTSSAVLPFQQLVEANLISSSFAYYNPDSQGYNYISSVTDLILPSQGYWVYVSSPHSVDLVFPNVLTPFVRSATTSTWTQSEKNWKLQLVAQNGKNVDSQNYIGVASAAVANQLNSRKPPIAPVANAVSLSVQDTISGKTASLAQALRSTGGNTQTWNVQVASKAAGQVTVNWPNMATVPSDVQFQLTDTATGATRDLRRSSGYTFTATAGSTRSFTISAVPGASAKPVIANLFASQTRGLSSVSVSYVLATDATVSVRVLSNGRAIYQAVTARSDHAGTNSAVWNLRDSANRQVAPGMYKIEVTAEGSDGQRVQKTIPVTVIR